jgi:hypothetical protein
VTGLLQALYQGRATQTRKKKHKHTSESIILVLSER